MIIALIIVTIVIIVIIWSCLYIGKKADEKMDEFFKKWLEGESDENIIG